MKLVNIPGTKVWVNPEYVTNVRGIAGGSIVEYVGNAGYQTRTTNSTASVEEVVTLLTGEVE
jgi:hypothetical protein